MRQKKNDFLCMDFILYNDSRKKMSTEIGTGHGVTAVIKCGSIRSLELWNYLTIEYGRAWYFVL